MNYNFIKIKPRGNYLTMIDPSNNPRYMCFSNKLDALHCITYISKFRSNHGYFPQIDLSKETNRHEIKSLITKKQRDVSTISKFMMIETMDQYNFEETCSKNNIGLFYVHSFSYVMKNNEMELLLSAQELNSDPDLYKYTKNLNKIYGDY